MQDSKANSISCSGRGWWCYLCLSQTLVLTSSGCPSPKTVAEHKHTED